MSEPNEPSGGNANHGDSNHISSPSINVVLGGGGVKAIIGALIGVGIILLLTVPVAKGADTKADNTTENEKRFEQRINDRVSAAELEARQAAYWLDQADASCAAAGMKMPPNPFFQPKR